MTKIKIKQIALINFKGIKNLVVNFNDGITTIQGDNATGKTTLIDAFNWLLFGKDSQDRKDFQIKPLDSNNQKTDKVETEVFGTFEIDGNETTIRRVFTEKWTKKRGSEVAEFTGNETKFFWNEVPFSLGEFESKIKSLVDESIFKLVTNTGRFNALNWKEQRAILFDIVNIKNDSEMALDLPIQKEDITQLVINVLNAGKTLDQYKKEIAVKKKNIKDELEQIPARISELQNIKPEVEFPEDAIERAISQLEIFIKEIDAKLTDENNRISEANAEVNKAKAENVATINKFKQELQDYRMTIQLELNGNINQLKAEKQQLYAKAGELGLEFRALANRVSFQTNELNKKITEKEGLISKWKAINESDFIAPEQEENCIACGQPVKHEIDVEGYRHKFNVDKSVRLANIESDGLKLKSEIEALEKEISELNAERATKERQSIQVQEQADAIVIPEQKSFEGDNFTKELETQIELHLNKTFEIVSDLTNIENLKKQKESLSVDLQDARKELSKFEEIERIDNRIQELEEREAVLASELASFEKQEFEIDEFTAFKINATEDKINALFEGIKFKMFNKLINGGIEETCEALINGVPYSDANNASKINAGLEIINVLSSYYKVEAPCFVDNAESVTRFTNFANQLILLQVSEGINKLRIS